MGGRAQSKQYLAEKKTRAATTTEASLLPNRAASLKCKASLLQLLRRPETTKKKKTKKKEKKNYNKEHKCE